MLNQKQIFGKQGESLAYKELYRRGYDIVETNFRTKQGEIDIIAMDSDVIVFIEVKARRTKRFGNAKFAITPAKKRKISMAALYYLKKEDKTKSRARFDVVIVHAENSQNSVEIIKNAFDLSYP